MISFLFAWVISLLGVPLGFALGKISGDEVYSGKRYLFFLQGISLFFVLIFAIKNLSLTKIIIVACIFAYLIIKFKPNAIISHLIFFLIFILNINDAAQLEIILPLIFVHGLSTGSLMAARGLRRYMSEEIENPVDKGYYAKPIQKVRYILWVLMLEIISIPSLFLSKKMNAAYHLKVVCPLCPSSRKKHRDVQGNSTCWWESQWIKHNYDIPKHFGIFNWIKQYTKKGTNLKKFR